MIGADGSLLDEAVLSELTLGAGGGRSVRGAARLVRPVRAVPPPVAAPPTVHAASPVAPGSHLFHFPQWIAWDPHRNSEGLQVERVRGERGWGRPQSTSSLPSPQSRRPSHLRRTSTQAPGSSFLSQGGGRVDGTVAAGELEPGVAGRLDGALPLRRRARLHLDEVAWGVLSYIRSAN